MNTALNSNCEMKKLGKDYEENRYCYSNIQLSEFNQVSKLPFSKSRRVSKDSLKIEHTV